MSENIELIAAGALPTTDAKEVDVLCVENGELKRKPGATLGGGGGYVIRLDETMLAFDEETGAYSAVYPGNYDEFADTFYKGGNIQIDFTNATTLSGGMFMRITPLLCSFIPFPDGNALAFGCFTGEAIIQVLCPNGTWTPPTA